jgi:hypothetical protein
MVGHVMALECGDMLCCIVLLADVACYIYCRFLLFRVCSMFLRLMLIKCRSIFLSRFVQYRRTIIALIVDCPRRDQIDH